MATELTAERLAELRERDRMLREFASDFRLDGDQLVCVHCERRCVGAREDEDFVHAPDCAARTVGGRPWVRLCNLLLMPIDLSALLRAAGERDELRARLRHDCKGCPGCGSNDCPDALDAAQHERDRLRAQRDALVAVLQSGQSLRTHDLNTTERWVIDDVDEVREAIRAAKENR